MTTTPSYIKEQQVIHQALDIVRKRLFTEDLLTSPHTVRRYLSLHFAEEEREVFCCLFLNSQHYLIACENLFYGTIDHATVHMREILKRALALNTAAVIVAHNHPSGVCEPSVADKSLTEKIRNSLALVDIRLLDHFVVGGDRTTSLAEIGYV